MVHSYMLEVLLCSLMPDTCTSCTTAVEAFHRPVESHLIVSVACWFGHQVVGCLQVDQQ
jgi:hypothetical protein